MDMHLATPAVATGEADHTCSFLRCIPSDPLLHRQRLHAVPLRLSRSLQTRPNLSALQPPNANIYLTSTRVAAIALSRKFIRMRLRSKLRHRPPVHDLVERGVLPGECFAFVTARSGAPLRPETRDTAMTSRSSGSSSETLRAVSLDERRRRSSSTFADVIGGDGFNPTGQGAIKAKYVSPRLIEAKRAVEREAIRDRIRHWVDGRWKQELERRRRETECELERANGSTSVAAAGGVKGLVRRFRARGQESNAFASTRASASGPKVSSATGTERWGKGSVKWVEKRRKEPTRAHVLGLRRFWEGVAHTDV